MKREFFFSLVFFFVKNLAMFNSVKAKGLSLPDVKKDYVQILFYVCEESEKV